MIVITPGKRERERESKREREREKLRERERERVREETVIGKDR